MRILQLLIIFVFVSTGYVHASELESTWISSDHVQARLISSSDDIAVQLRMTKGWHTYWKSPGDAGLPPRFDWSASENIASVEIEWPAPKRFEEMGLHTFGYLGDVTFPAHVTRTDIEQEANLHLKLDVMVCKDICVPQTLELDLSLSGEIDGSAQRLIKSARRKVPVAGDMPQLKIDTVVTGPDAVVISTYSKRGFDRIDAFVIVDDDLALTSKPEIMIDERDEHKALIKIPTPDDFEVESTLSVTLTNGSNAVEKTVQF